MREISPRNAQSSGTKPLLGELQSAFQSFHLEALLGPSGANTAYAFPGAGNEKYVVFHTVPGSWSPDDLAVLLHDAKVCIDISSAN